MEWTDLFSFIEKQLQQKHDWNLKKSIPNMLFRWIVFFTCLILSPHEDFVHLLLYLSFWTTDEIPETDEKDTTLLWNCRKEFGRVLPYGLHMILQPKYGFQISAQCGGLHACKVWSVSLAAVVHSVNWLASWLKKYKITPAGGQWMIYNWGCRHLCILIWMCWLLLSSKWIRFALVSALAYIFIDVCPPSFAKLSPARAEISLNQD